MHYFPILVRQEEKSVQTAVFSFKDSQGILHYNVILYHIIYQTLFALGDQQTINFSILWTRKQ